MMSRLQFATELLQQENRRSSEDWVFADSPWLSTTNEPRSVPSQQSVAMHPKKSPTARLCDLAI